MESAKPDPIGRDLSNPEDIRSNISVGPSKLRRTTHTDIEPISAHGERLIMTKSCLWGEDTSRVFRLPGLGNPWHSGPRSAMWDKSSDAISRDQSQAVVLTKEESDEVVGDLETLKLRIQHFWPDLLNNNVTDTTESEWYTQWLSYFISRGIDFGVVHAWISALREWTRSKQIARVLSPPYDEEARKRALLRYPDPFSLPEPFLQPPAMYSRNEEGEVLAGLVGPLLGRQITNENGNEVIAVHSDKRPRRIWDICANRIVPSSWFPKEMFEQCALTLVSHAWVEDPTPIMTEINLKTWPVPIPPDINLETVRAHLMQRNARYAWLDVLCLRQGMKPRSEPDVAKFLGADVIEHREALGTNEWRSDVPLLGALYREQEFPVMVYLNGLGRPFDLQQKIDWKYYRNWVRRIWTLQETTSYNKFDAVGLERDDLLKLIIDEETQTSLGGYISTLSQPDRSWKDITNLVTEIHKRYASEDAKVDRVAGILYFCIEKPEITSLSRPLPIYKRGEKDLEAAWTRLVQATANVKTGSLLVADNWDQGFVFQLLRFSPYPSSKHWFPSWEQLMSPKSYIYEPQSVDLPDS